LEDFGSIDVLLLIITFISTALSAPTGTGGGGIMVPVFMLMCGFSAQDAIPLSKVRGSALCLHRVQFMIASAALEAALSTSNFHRPLSLGWLSATTTSTCRRGILMYGHSPVVMLKHNPGFRSTAP
jgi:hypothetical protein